MWFAVPVGTTMDFGLLMTCPCFISAQPNKTQAHSSFTPLLLPLWADKQTKKDL